MPRRRPNYLASPDRLPGDLPPRLPAVPKRPGALRAASDGSLGFRYKGPFDASILQRMEGISELTMVTAQHSDEGYQVSAVLPGQCQYSSRVIVAALVKDLCQRGSVESIY